MKSLEQIRADEAARVLALKQMPKPGRPPRSGKKPADVRVTIRLTKAEHATWTKMAGALPLGEWIRQRCAARP
jgi:hypothetical protein